MHRSYTEIGEYIADGWGPDDRGDLKAFIRGMTDAERTVCLLSAVVRRLVAIDGRIARMEYALQNPEPTPDKHPVADGIREALRWEGGDRRIPEDWSALSVRARKALRRTGIEYISEITPERLTGVRFCGAVTIRELCKWAKSL